MKLTPKSLTTAALLVLVLFLSVTDAAAQYRRRAPSPRTSDQAVELSGSYGHMWGGHISLRNGKLRINTAPAWSGALDIPVARDTWVELSYTRQSTAMRLDRLTEKRDLSDMSVNYWQIGGLKGVKMGNVMPFGLVSLGITHYGMKETSVRVDGKTYPMESITRFSMRFGVGFKAYFGRAEKVGIRAQFMLMPTIFDASGGLWFGSGGVDVGLYGQGVWQYEVSGGLTLKFGK